MATIQWDGNPEPVIREILQNALDAAVKSRATCCLVDFSIREAPLDQVPGIDAYRDHFHAAVRERQAGIQGTAEKEIISRIDNTLKKDRIRLLFCRDNGIGLTPTSMKGLLTEGNTDKSDEGAGSYGVGHLTAFAASNTRYVLYAAINRNGPGRRREIASGHAILASRTELDDYGRVRKAFGAHGHWVVPVGQLGLFDPTYPSEAPLLLKKELDKLEDTGTVVCITGFNDFRDANDEDPTEAIARVAAKNYLVAIWRQEMVVYIGDETKTPEREYIVDEANLHNVLHPHRKQKRTRSGWLPGEQAYRCLRTLREGEWLSLACGAKARVRLLDAKEGRSSRAQLFRDGMWIDNQADALHASSFTGYRPFDAAIMIGRSGHMEARTPTEIETLVRSAEGPEHRGIDRRRLGSWRARQRLLQLLRDIRDELQQWAGEIEEEEEDIPDDFAVFAGNSARSVVPEPPYRPREPQLSEEEDGRGKVGGKSAKPSGQEEEAIDPNGKRRKKEPGSGARPKPGNSIPGSMATVAQPELGDNRSVNTFHVYWKAASKAATTRAGQLGVRVRIPSGSDTTCELPLGPQWLKLMEVRPRGGAPTDIYDRGYEAALPPSDELELTIRLHNPVIDPRSIEALEVDIVGRTRPRPVEASEKEVDS